MPVKAGSRMRTGAPLAKARITPAAPTPPPMSAEPEITAWMVSPAPCGADVLQHQAVLLEDAGVLAERRRLVFPVVDLADRDLELSSAKAEPAASANGAARPSATACLL